MEIERRKTFLINFSYFITVAFIVFMVCSFILKYLFPFVIGGIIAFAVQSPAEYVSKKTGLKAPVTAGILAGTVFVLILLTVVFAVFGAVNTVESFSNEIMSTVSLISDIFEKIDGAVDGLLIKMPSEFSKAFKDVYDKLPDKIVNYLTGVVSKFAGTVAGYFPSFLISAVVAAVSSCYIATNFKGLIRFFKNMAGENIYKKSLKLKSIITDSVFCYFKGYLIILLLTTTELAFGFFFLRINYAIPLAILIAFIDFLPILGTGTVLVPWGLYQILFGNTFKGVGIIIIYIIITVVRNFAEPKIIGGKIGINPLFTLLAVFIGLKTAGIAGMFVFPIVLVVIIKYYKTEP